MPTTFVLAARAGAGQPTGPGFDLLLLCHVACVLLGFASMVVSAVQASRLRGLGSGPLPEALRRYYAPGTNWFGRILYGVPVFGFALLADSGGTFGFGDLWVVLGLVAWLGAAGAAEGLLWPAERRIQAALAAGALPTGPSGAALAPSLVGEARTIALVGWSIAVILVVVTVLMVAQP